jgi:hypothetical protein
MKFQKIEKEEISALQFPSNDVLQNEERKVERSKKLIRASILGNLEKEKCKILFRSSKGHNYVETTIWAVTDKYVCLKGGVAILITAIIEVI